MWLADLGSTQVVPPTLWTFAPSWSIPPLSLKRLGLSGFGTFKNPGRNPIFRFLRNCWLYGVTLVTNHWTLNERPQKMFIWKAIFSPLNQLHYPKPSFGLVHEPNVTDSNHTCLSYGNANSKETNTLRFHSFICPSIDLKSLQKACSQYLGRGEERKKDGGGAWSWFVKWRRGLSNGVIDRPHYNKEVEEDKERERKRKRDSLALLKFGSSWILLNSLSNYYAGFSLVCRVHHHHLSY